MAKTSAARRRAAAKRKVVRINSTPARGRSRSRVRSIAGAPASTAMSLFRPRQDVMDQELSGFPARNAKGRRRVRASNRGLPPTVLGYVDPWSVEAAGIKYPDEYRGLSGAYTGVFETSIATSGAAGTYTDANMVGVVPLGGTSLFLVTPDPSNLLVTGVCGTNSAGFYAGVPKTFAWPNGIVYTGVSSSLNAFGPGSGVLNVDIVLPSLLTLRQLFSGVRLVTGGVKMTSNMNFSSVSGTIHVCPVFVNTSHDTSTGASSNPTTDTLQNGWQTALPQSLADMINLPGYKHFALSSLQADEVVALFRPYGPESRLFKPTSGAWGMDESGPGLGGSLANRHGDSNNPDSVGHYSICVYIDGVSQIPGGPAVPLTPLIELEELLHLECQPNPSSAVISSGLTLGSGTAMCAMSPPFQPLLMAASDNLSADVPVVRCIDASGVEEERFVNDVVNTWKGAARIASSVVSAVGTATTILSALAL